MPGAGPFSLHPEEFHLSTPTIRKIKPVPTKAATVIQEKGTNILDSYLVSGS